MIPQKVTAWWLACRPKTLLVGASPVIVGLSLTTREVSINIIPAVLCFAFALFSQIASNLCNDYFDFKNHIDTEERVGPARALASGWLSEHEMRIGIGICLGLAGISGLGLIPYGGWQLILVGIGCVIGLWAYSSGPYPLAANGLGEIAVILFFGVIAVGFTYFVQILKITGDVFRIGIGIGFAAANILVVNNYRDVETDRQSGKKTLIVRYGRGCGKIFYFFNGIIAGVLCIWSYPIFSSSIIIPYLLVHLVLYRILTHNSDPKVFNKLLGLTSLNLFFLSLLLTLLYCSPFA